MVAQNQRRQLVRFRDQPDPKVWEQVCSERGLCSPKVCGEGSEFSKSNPVCFYQRARRHFNGCDVLVLNHTLFFTLLGTNEEPVKGGLLFKNDFIVFDEAHTMESVASRHIGLSVSRGQVYFNLRRLWNPQTSKCLLAAFHTKTPEMLVQGCSPNPITFSLTWNQRATNFAPPPRRARFGAGEYEPRTKDWNVLRVRRAELVADTLSCRSKPSARRSTSSLS